MGLLKADTGWLGAAVLTGASAVAGTLPKNQYIDPANERWQFAAVRLVNGMSWLSQQVLVGRASPLLDHRDVILDRETVSYLQRAGEPH